ncbi:unnamed protein product [Dracunculus medinensis]|uniref:CUB domain-containing protein n=1 Tax=Dracunculus medinensis TaxID=318479 RepID=A0A0N4UR71_DRAME|nr:unnamed protein product [Dracunculus medinensis]
MSGGIFQSPNYPIIFSDEKCFIYQFIAPTNYIVQTIFSFFNLSPRRNDRIYDQTMEGRIDEATPYSHELCGVEIAAGTAFYSLTSYLVFHLRLSHGIKGFHGTYKFVAKGKFRMNATEVQPCRYSMDFLEGSIFSPQYPYSYPSLVNCSYYFPNRNSMKLVLSLDYLDLNTDSCRADFIDIYQMQPKVSKKIPFQIHLDRLCYDSIPPYSISSRNGLILQFHSGINDKKQVC